MVVLFLIRVHYNLKKKNGNAVNVRIKTQYLILFAIAFYRFLLFAPWYLLQLLLHSIFLACFSISNAFLRFKDKARRAGEQ